MKCQSILQRTKHFDIFDAENKDVKKDDEPLASSYRENNLIMFFSWKQWGIILSLLLISDIHPF